METTLFEINYESIIIGLLSMTVVVGIIVMVIRFHHKRTK